MNNQHKMFAIKHMSILEITSQDFKEINVTKKNSIFNLRINNNSYLISSHSYLPIKSLKIDENYIDSNDLLVNSNWNDLLIIKNRYQVSNTFDKIRKTILSIGTRFIIGCNPNYVLEEIEYENFAFLPNYPRLMYYKIFGNTNHLRCGDPILNINGENLELVGIVSSVFENYVYGLPSYYIYKTIKRSNNDIMIPNLNSIQEIAKIDNFKINNGVIWNKFIKFNIPVDVNFLLESDKEKIYEINGDKIIPEYIKFENKSAIPNSDCIFIDDKYFILTSRLLHLIKLYSNDYITQIWDSVKNLTKRLLENETLSSTSLIKLDVDSNGKLIVLC